jgi:protein pelota
MKILKIDKKTNEIVVLPQNLNDLWHLEKVIDIGDLVKGKTDRKIKPSKEGEKTIRQTMFVEIKVETVHFQEFSENLKIGGIIMGGSPKEFIELKTHQSIDLFINDKVSFVKKIIKSWQIERLEKAKKESASSRLLVVLMDDEQAELAFISQFSIDKKATITTKKAGKQYKEETNNKYFEEVLDKIVSLSPSKILLAGPGFTKENFVKYVEEKNKKIPKIFIESTNSVGETGYRELISQGKLDKIEKELQLSKETQVIEEFLAALPKKLGEYGVEKVKELINIGAVESLIVSETYLLQNRNKTEEILDLGERVGCKINIISSKNPQEKSIHNFGGVVAKLRYKVD